jgi:pimeloyl-ACP methyl ester carboxylesterase
MERIVRVEGRRVAVVDAVGLGAPLLCVPGGPGYGGDQLVRLGGLSAGRTLLRLDLRGAGLSDAPASGTYAFTDYAADLEQVRCALGLERIDLFGHAHGGVAVAVYARVHPDRVGRVVLDGLPLRPPEEFDQWERTGISDYFHSFDSRAAHYVEAHMTRIHEPAIAWFWDHEAMTTDYRATVRALTCPTLLVTGASDPMCGERAVQSLAAGMDDASTAVIPQASHFTWVENPTTFAAAVETFLRVPVDAASRGTSGGVSA